MKIKIIILSLTLIIPILSYCQKLKEMPIIAYMGVPENMTNEENFRIMSECGFSVSIRPYRNLDGLIRACRAAEKYGIKILGTTDEITENPTKAAQKLKQEKGFFGYHMMDEPDVEQIKSLQQIIKQIKKIDNNHCFYINLNPYTYPEWVLGTTKVKTYPEYIKAITKTDCQQISFDNYPVTRKGLKENWYYNLEMIRNESLLSGKPFWAFALSVPHKTPYSDYPSPTKASLRLQIYSNLVYGAKAIQYFTYWTPGENEGFNYHDAPISREGNKTKTYALVQSMNKELKQIAPLFYNGEVVSVHHLGKNIPVGTTRMKGLPVNLSSLKIVNKKGCILSTIKYENHLYLCVVNKDYKESISLLLSAKNNIPVKIEKNLTTQPLQNKYSIEPGDIAIFKLN